VGGRSVRGAVVTNNVTAIHHQGVRVAKRSVLPPATSVDAYERTGVISAVDVTPDLAQLLSLPAMLTCECSSASGASNVPLSTDAGDAVDVSEANADRLRTVSTPTDDVPLLLLPSFPRLASHKLLTCQDESLELLSVAGSINMRIVMNIYKLFIAFVLTLRYWRFLLYVYFYFASIF